MLMTRLGHAAERWAAQPSPWTNVYGLSRTLLALGTAGTLAASSVQTLFRPALGLPAAPYCLAANRISLFCVMPRDELWLARWLAIVMLLIVASGWRPRLTALPHWWVAFSLQSSATLPDGGDQVTEVLTLLMLPLALTDPRGWHWHPGPLPTSGTAPVWRRLLALSAVSVIRVQVAGIYFHSSLGKLAVPEWGDGSALYYWLLDPDFGAPGYVRGVLAAILTNGVAVAALTWGTLVLEFTLALALVLPRTARAYLLVCGIGFHLMIAVLMGLTSFALAMFAALIIFLRPVDQPFAIARLSTDNLSHVPVLRLARLLLRGAATSGSPAVATTHGSTVV